MRRVALAFLLVLYACAGVPVDHPAPAPQSLADAFAAAVRRQPRALFASLDAPVGPQALVDGQNTVTVAGHLGAWRARDGSWLVHVPATGARITAYSTSEGAAGAMLNVRGTNQTDVHASRLALPCAVVPCDALVVASTGSGRGGYWEAPGRSQCDQMLAVVFVPYQVGPGLLRPPAIGNDSLTRFLRTLPIPESIVDVATLPSVVDVDGLPIDWSAWGHGKPTIPYLTALLRRFGGECYDGWATDTRTPDHQHPGYGTAYASVVSQAGLQLCSTAPSAAKLELALAVVQRGLDLVGAFADSRRNYPSGGHMAGRKALVVLAGHLMAIEPMANPTSVVGPVFQEDGTYTAQPWWFGEWTAGWRFALTPPGDGALLGSPPATWGPVDAVQHDSFAWQIAGYMPQVVGAQVGTALTMRLLGRTRELGAAFDAMIDQWMQGPPAAARAQLELVGIRLPWQTSYSMVKGGGLCEAAWRRYASLPRT